MNKKDRYPQNLLEETADILAKKLISSLEDDISVGWIDLANLISDNPDSAKKFFSEKTVKLAQFYVSSMNLFVDMDENSDLISGLPQEEVASESSSESSLNYNELLDEGEE
jgi:hypothetical protein